MGILQHVQHVQQAISAHIQEQVLHLNVVLDSFQDLDLHNAIVVTLVIFAIQQLQLKHTWKQIIVLVNHA